MTHTDVLSGEATTASLFTVEQELLSPARVSSEAILEVAGPLHPETPKKLRLASFDLFKNNSFVLRPFPFRLFRTCARMIFVTTMIIHNGREKIPEVRR